MKTDASEKSLEALTFAGNFWNDKLESRESTGTTRILQLHAAATLPGYFFLRN